MIIAIDENLRCEITNYTCYNSISMPNTWFVPISANYFPYRRPVCHWSRCFIKQSNSDF